MKGSTRTRLQAARRIVHHGAKELARRGMHHAARALEVAGDVAVGIGAAHASPDFAEGLAALSHGALGNGKKRRH